jgi:crotonobetainyl-CoA:carnitine CoA-transferase CaiB-like acyl-CoA transferase
VTATTKDQETRMTNAVESDTARPLAGLRVIDASQMLAGPIAAMRLGDLGADVIKLEPPGTGEWTRTHGFANATVGGESTAVLGLNRNKRSLALDLKTEEGLAALHAVLTDADVFLQNFRVGTAERLGIGYEQLREAYPGLVYCQITGYGEDGPYRDNPGQDLLLQGLSGSMWSVGAKSDPPVPGPLWAADAMTGYQAAIGILAALRERERSGLGQKVSVDMWSVVMDCQAQEFTTYLNCGIEPERTEEPFAHAWCNPPYGIYVTRDSYILISQVPIDALGDAVDDDRLRAITSWEAAHEQRDDIRRILDEIMPRKTTAEWLDILRSRKLWAGPIYSYADVAADPHVKARGMIVSVEHPTAGTLRLPAVPLRFSRSIADVRLPPPLLGQHTGEVLREAGLPAETIRILSPDHDI